MEKKNNNKKSSKKFMNKINATYGKQGTKEIPIEDSKTHTSAADVNPDLSAENENLEENVQETSRNSNNETELDKVIAEKNSLEDQLKRMAAEFENYKRRTSKEKMDLIEYGNSNILSKFVELLDDIRNAEKASNATTDIASVQQGLDMIYQKAVKLFADEGVKAMDTQIGDDFDVDFHEALMRQDSELEENKIVNILQTGYTYRDRILRYAKVITSTGNKQ